MQIGAVRDLVPDKNTIRERLRRVPYDEALGLQFMEILINEGDDRGAMEVYTALRQELQSRFDVLPGQEIETLSRQIAARLDICSPEEIQDRLEEETLPDGPCLCSLDEFRLYYRAEQRMAPRRGDAIHLLLLTVTGSGDPSEAMSDLEHVLRTNLRSVDVAAACGACQYLVMLVQAGYEDSLSVAQRLSSAFVSPTGARLDSAVIPMRVPSGGKAGKEQE